MSDFLNMEFVQALNPLYAFPIVTVILCAFIVYAFGFKSPVQPPSFEGIEEEKKISRKRKSKETSKQAKVVQNGKMNGSTVNKPHISPPGKKKEVEKATLTDKPATEKSSTNEKKAAKKAKSQNEKKNILEKKKEALANEDTAEDGWVQLISKKGRKSRKKDDSISTESHSVAAKPVKISEIGKSDDGSPSEESSEKTVEVSVQNLISEKIQPAMKEEKSKKKETMNELNKPALKEEKSKKKETKEERNVFEAVPNPEINKEKMEVHVKSDTSSLEKVPSKENVKSGKPVEESSNKSKKKKKKNAEIINIDNESINSLSEPPPIQVNSEPSTDKNAAIDSAITVEASQVVSDMIEENQPKESKSSNVVFDELAGLYPEAKEQRKKKKVRRDH